MTVGNSPLGIVVGADGSASSTAAVRWAAGQAGTRNRALRIVHAVAPLVSAGGPWPEVQVPADVVRLQQVAAQAVLDQAHRTATDAAGANLHVSSEVVFSPIVPTLVEMSKDADMMVVGCRGEGAVRRALLGSVSSGLVHHAHCPVAVIHAEELRSPEAPVLVGVDGSPASELATAIAFDQASRRGVDLVALHAWSDMGPINFASANWSPIEWRNIKVEEEEVLSERLSGWNQEYPNVTVHKVVVCDRPAPRLLEQAEHASLIVVGSHGRGGFPGMLLGSVSATIVHSAQIPVIVARLPSRLSAAI